MPMQGYHYTFFLSNMELKTTKIKTKSCHITLMVIVSFQIQHAGVQNNNKNTQQKPLLFQIYNFVLCFRNTVKLVALDNSLQEPKRRGQMRRAQPRYRLSGTEGKTDSKLHFYVMQKMQGKGKYTQWLFYYIHL